jgi:amino acid adenylation domain-containing protein
MAQKALTTGAQPEAVATSEDATALEKKLAGLTDSQRKRLEDLLERRTIASKTSSAGILRKPRKEGDNEFNLSFAQERLWFLDQIQPSIYNLQGILRILGPLNPEWLCRAFQQLVKRHESLRTTFHLKDSSPIQVVHGHQTLEIPWLDLAGVSEEACKTEITALVHGEQHWKFNLQAGPLLRVSVAKVGPHEHLLVYTLHHIAADGWSIGILNREITALYTAKGKLGGLPPLAIQYGDYAEWQREQGAGEEWDQHRDYWLRQLQDVPNKISLVLDRARHEVSTMAGAKATTRIDAVCLSKIKSFCLKEETTLFTFLFAVFKLLLYKFSGQRDMVVGTPVANRHSREEERLIGFFVNLLPLRTAVEKDLPFADFLSRVKQTVMAALTHQQYPFDRIVEQLKCERGTNETPLLQIIFELNNQPGESLSVAEFTFESVEAETWAAAYDLRFSFSESSDGLSLNVIYNKDLFFPATIQRYLEGYRHLVEEILSEPRKLVRNISVIGGRIRDQMRRSWCCAPAGSSHTSAGIFIDHFEAAVARHADRTAVSDDQGGSLTYRELNVRATQLANRLHALGSRTENVVGVVLDRSIDFVIAVLGILKTGAAYLPLDPDDPEERMTQLLQNASVTLLATNRATIERLPAGTVVIVCVDEPVAESEIPLPPRCVFPESLAYILYTSGSSGEPKGVMVCQAALWHYVQWAVEFYSLKNGEGCLVHTNPGFDLTITGLFPPLIAGKKVSLITAKESWREVGRSFEAARNLSLIKQTPSHMELLSALQPTTPEGRTRAFVIGGEALRYEQLAFWRASAPSTCLYNEYGPTEAVVGCSVYRVKPEDPSSGAVPIGRPISGVELFVLDEEIEIVPAQVLGELHISGPDLARSYINRPDLTAGVFLPNPWSATPGGRFYKTGDWVYWRNDGELVYVGRKDSQLKVRGFRVELEEIEFHLKRCPGVLQALVVPETDVAGGVQLTAFCVASPNQASPDGVSSSLADCLKKKIPQFMMPRRFVCIDAIPLTPNGKIDLSVLRQMCVNAAPAGPIPENAANTPLEEIILGVWKEVLNSGEIGVGDNFFQLGGYSLLMAQIIARIGEVLGVMLSINDFFEDATVRGLARKADLLRLQSRSPLPAVERVSRDLPQPLSFAQERLWFMQTVDVGTTAFNVPLFLRISGDLSMVAFRRAVFRLVERHESLRTIFPENDGEPRQQVLKGLEVEMPVIDLQDAGEQHRTDELRRRASEIAMHPFNLRVGPLIRLTLFVLGKNEFAFLAMLHHINSDARSIEILLAEMETLYSAFLIGAPDGLAEFPLQYLDYSSWQREFLRPERLEPMLKFWEKTLENYSPGDELPYDFPRSGPRVNSAGIEPILLDPELTAGLRVLSQAAGCTLFMTLLTTFKVLLHLYSGKTDLLIAIPVSNRRDTELSGIVGLFLNQVLVRTVVSGEMTVLDCLAQVRSNVLNALDYQDLPFEKLVERFRLGGKMGEAPLTQVMFNFLSRPIKDRLELVGLKIEGIGLGEHEATMDVKLTLAESGDQLVGGMEYRRQLFRPETVRRLASDFVALARCFVRLSSEPIRGLSLMTAQEQKNLEALETSAGLNFD